MNQPLVYVGARYGVMREVASVHIEDTVQAVEAALVPFVEGPGRSLRGDGLRRLAPRNDLWNHSGDFEWGYEGSGPAQLALAILADALGPGAESAGRAIRLHQKFKSEVVAALPREGFRLARADVAAWLEAHP